MKAPFGMTDKQFRDVMLVLIAVLAAYLYFKKKAQENADSSGNDESNDPMLLSFSNNPSQFLPPQIGVTVNVPSAFGGQYTPLFGFVGIAQGEMLA